jgi:polyisoprenoid-binding protein YceI
MKKSILTFSALFVAVSMFLACGGSQQTEETTESTTEEAAAEETTKGPVTYNVVDGSSVNWKGVMLGIKSHEGTVGVQSGTLTMENGQITGGNFTIDMTSITPLDENYDEENTSEKLVGHLSSPDFFNVENHPAATFTITSVNGTDVTGMMNIRGIEHEETFNNVSVTDTEGGVSVSGDITIDRKKYDVSFDMPVADMVISDEIEMTLAVNGAQM